MNTPTWSLALLLTTISCCTSEAADAPWTSSSLLQDSATITPQPIRSSSRARISVTDLEDDLFPRSREQTGWTSQELDTRSPQCALSLGGAKGSARQGPSSNAPQLQLHLEENSGPSNPSNHEHSFRKYYKKTGTTIAGCVCRGHVILAADTRATQSTIVADKVAQKLHVLAPNAWCAGAGTSADLEMLTRLCTYSLALETLVSNSVTNSHPTQLQPLYTTPEKEEDENALLSGTVTLEQICTFLQDRLWKAKGQLGVNLILGCVDQGKTHLRAFHEHGSMDVDLPFAALGSGGLAAMSIMERGYRNNLTVDEATDLVKSAIVAGIQNDLGSGSQVDLCVISPDGSSKMTRAIVPSQVLREGPVPMRSDTPMPQHKETFGINGFGITPFGIKAERNVTTSQKKGSFELDIV